MAALATANKFYTPTAEHIAKLSGPWCASFSGGKDSTSLVTWIEWLRRTGQIDAPHPQLVQSDTTVEYPALQAISRDMMQLLRGCGWECAVVEPKIHEKLYNRILGIGNTPIHPGIRSMRWCTRATKIGPMERWQRANSSGVTITGLRLGESTIRDGKIKRRGCSAGGECGIPDPTERTYSPILRWSTCQIWDWLYQCGVDRREVVDVMRDTRPLTRALHDIYDVRVDEDVFEWADPVVTSARFGCIGCPAIQVERNAPKSVTDRDGASPLNELYDVWFEARLPHNRLYNPENRWGGKVKQAGPIKLEIRKVLFARVMDIQRRAGIVLITPEDEAFIRHCWENKVYPRGWSEADEATVAPREVSLFVINGGAN